MNRIATFFLKTISIFFVITSTTIFSLSEVEKLSQRLQYIIHTNNKTQSQYSSPSVMHQEYDYLVYNEYKTIQKEYGHLTVNQWRKAYDIAIHTPTIKNLIKNYWNGRVKHDQLFYNSLNYYVAEFFIWLNNELTLLYYSALDNVSFSHGTLRELGNSKKTRYLTSDKKVITTTIDDKIHEKYVFEIYPGEDNGKAQKEILQALHRILTCDVDYIGIDDFYRQYDNAVKKVGHYSVFSWWSAFNARTQAGKTILDIPTNSWYMGGKSELERMKYLLDIAMNEGKNNISYIELLNTLESFYSRDDQYRNSVIKEMISERDHLPFFKNKS